LRRLNPTPILLAAVLAPVALLPARFGAPLAAIGLLAAARRTEGRRRAARRRGTLLLALGALLELLAAAVVGVGALRSGGAEARLRQSYLAFWNEVDRDAGAAAVALAAPLPEEDRLHELFRRLERSAGRSGAPEERTFLFFDAQGDLEAWCGSGLLHPLPAGAADGVARGAEPSALAVTPYVARRVRLADGEEGRLLVGQSFPLEGGPPVAAADRERFRVAGWSLVEGEAGGWPALALDGAVRERPWLDPAALERAGALAIGWGLAIFVAAGSRFLLKRGRATPFRIVLLALFGAAAIAALSVGAGAGRGPALVAGASALAAGAGLFLGRRRAAGALPLVAAVASGPLLLLLFDRLPVIPRGVSSELFGGGDLIATRVAATLLVFASLVVAGRARARPDGAALTGRVTIWLGFAAAAAATLVVDRSGLVAVLLGLAGLAGGLAATGPNRSGILAKTALLVLAATVAGAAASAGGWLAERREAASRLATLLPPTAQAADRLAAAVERGLEPGARRLPTSEELAARGVSPDLPYAIWRDSPLARADLLSALTVVPPSGAPESFSYGLPIDGEGRIDPSAVRWVDLAPAAWRSDARAGEIEIQGRAERPWRLRWAFAPRIGFDADPAGSARGPLRHAWRAGRTLALLPELPGRARAMILDGERRIVAASWLEGSPGFDERWLGESSPLSSRALTPDGVARVGAVSGGGLVAALFVPSPSPAEALERGGIFVAGVLLLVGLAVALAFGIAVSRRVAVTAVRRTLRSYSRRLVLVFAACLLIPLATIYPLVSRALEHRLEREQESAALDAIRSAQRVLGEYVLSLDPGFGVGTALDDRLLEWLARVVRNEIHLYWGSEVYASSKRDLFSSGLLPRRLPGEVWERLHLGHERLARRLTRSGNEQYVELFAPLEIPGLASESTKLVLALPQLGRQEELEREVDAVRRRTLLATLAIATLIAVAGAVAARRFTRPIDAIVAGTRRIAEGAEELGYRPEESELEALAVAIDAMAGRIAEARRRLLVEKRLVDRIVENVTAAVVGLDREGRVIFANRLARSLLGAAPGESLAGALSAAGLERAGAAMERASATQEPVAVRVEVGEAERDWTLVRAPLPGSGEPSELVVVEDVTDVVRAQRLDAWAAMARIIAHEIKNPLTPIRLSTEHLREAWARDREHFASVFERCTTNILAQVEELRQTASEFSLYSEIPRIEPQRADLGQAVRDIVEAYLAAPPSQVAIELEAPETAVMAEFDRRLLGRAVRNLIENAVRASSGGGAVDVAVERRAASAAIRVGDRGAGVPPELLGRILEPYFSTQSGGTGLGLPIARRVAEEHGGELAVRNRPEGGFEVTITIPLA